MPIGVPQGPQRDYWGSTEHLIARAESTFRGTTVRLHRVMNNPSPVLMMGVGKVLVDQAKFCFVNQVTPEFEPWPERYPNRRGLKINIAGAVSDLRWGPTIKSNRFTDRPANIDTHALMNSVRTHVTGKYSVEARSDLDYAHRANSGGLRSQTIDKTIKDNLAAYLRGASTVTEVVHTVGGLIQHRKRTRTSQYKSTLAKFVRKEIGFLFRKRMLVTEVAPRQFLGVVTPAMMNRIASWVVRFVVANSQMENS